MASFDVAIIGLGAMGSAALAALASRSRRAIGIDRYVPGHDRGSSHGATRVIRLGYFEDPCYVPLLRAAYPLWRELEARSGRELLTITGIVEIGAPESELVAGTLLSSRHHGIACEILDAPAVMKRFPAFRLPKDFVGVFQPDGGFLRAEDSLEAMLALARGSGAEVSVEHVLGIEPHRGGVRIAMADRAVSADRAIVAAGPWLPSLLPDLPVALCVTRQVLGWFEPRDQGAAAVLSRGRFPVFLLQNPEGMFYGFPADDAG